MAFPVLTDAGKMALCYALRRDWRPWPATGEWGPEMQAALFELAAQIDAEEQARFTYQQEAMPI